MDRKEFINRVIRIFLLGGMVFLTGFIVTRRKLKQGNACTPDTVCGSCPKLSDCSKEEALKLKRDGRS
jgi:hypothetical protein